MMGLNRILSSAALVATLSLMGGAASAGTQIVDVSSLGSTGTVLSLAAGTYSFNYIGIADGGAYDAWSPWSSVQGCNGSGMNCSTGYTLSIAIDFGYGIGNFSHQDGYQYGLLSAGNNHLYQSAALALASFDPADLVMAPLPQASDINAYTSSPYPMTFTLAAAQTVNFFILDFPYGDNQAGVSLLLDDGIRAVPEPASWAMMIFGLGAMGLVMRRRERRFVAG